MSEVKTVPIGFTNFDSGSESSEIEIRIPKNRIVKIHRGQYVRIECDTNANRTNFFAIISRGPFFEPDAVSKDSAFARASILQADTVKFIPDYHGVCFARIIAQLDLKSMQTVGSFIRPFPQGKVFALSSKEIESLLELKGDMFLGELHGYQDVKIRMPSNRNAALPRNVGIFGTVGSGKTNTAQVLIEEASAAGWAVLILDIEGEYVSMDSPSDQTSLSHHFERFGVSPQGIENFAVHHIINYDSARDEDERPASIPLSVRFSGIRPEILVELLDLSAPQTEQFLAMWFELARRREPGSSRRGGRNFVSHLLDGEPGGPPLGITLQDMLNEIDSRLGGDRQQVQGARSTFFVLRRKIRKLLNYDIFDHEESFIDHRALLQGGKVSVVDLSGSYSSVVNNIVITDMLRNLFDLKVADRNNTLPPIMIVIEEAHSYISKENASKMEETLDVLREISRRGRKRWVSLCFISQQPSHLPPEIYELCNTRFIHQTSGGRNLDAIKTSTGAVDPSIWNDVPQLGQGSSLFVSSYFKNRPMFMNVRPSKSRRRHVEE